MRALLLGGCNIHSPINGFIRAGGQGVVRPELSRDRGSLGVVYTFGEMYQAVAFLRGDITLPPEVRLLTGIRPKFDPLPEVVSEAVDVALAAPSAALELIYRGYKINRGYLNQYVYDPIRALSPEMYKLIHNWYQNGVVPQNEQVQRDAAERLIARLPEGHERADLAASVLRELCAEPTEVERALPGFYNLADMPVGLLTWALRYMPDGRPVFWPKYFADAVLSVSRKLGLPTMEPWRLVHKHGVAAAIQSDMRHYTDEFNPIIGEAIVEFAQRVTDHGRMALPTSKGRGREGAPPDGAVSDAIHQHGTAPARPRILAGAAATRVNALLRELHRKRVSEFGVDESGLHDHYNRLLESDRLVGPQVGKLADLIAHQLPEYESYHVLRCGLGELAFVLAVMGLGTWALEAAPRRYGAIEAGLAALRDAEPEAAQRLTLRKDVIPRVALGNNILAVAVHLVGFRPEQEGRALDGLSRYRAVLLDPRLFLRRRTSPAERQAAVDAVQARGFPIVTEIPGVGLVLCARPPEDESVRAIIREETPAAPTSWRTWIASRLVGTAALLRGRGAGDRKLGWCEREGATSAQSRPSLTWRDE